jgi:GTPase SAR1 family protein
VNFTPEKIKIIVVGESGVGKNTLISKIAFSPRPQNSPIGMNFYSIKVYIENIEIQPMFSVISAKIKNRLEKGYLTFYKDAVGAILLFDLSRLDTISYIQDELPKIKEVNGNTIPFLLVGNKKDLVEDNQYSDERKDLRVFAEENNGFYIEASSPSIEKYLDTFEPFLIQSLIFHCDKYYSYFTKEQKPIKAQIEKILMSQKKK